MFDTLKCPDGECNKKLSCVKVEGTGDSDRVKSFRFAPGSDCDDCLKAAMLSCFRFFALNVICGEIFVVGGFKIYLCGTTSGFSRTIPPIILNCCQF